MQAVVARHMEGGMFGVNESVDLRNLVAFFAIVYLVNGTIRIEHAVDDPEKFVEDLRAGALSKR